jgi:hypothetical protein
MYVLLPLSRGEYEEWGQHSKECPETYAERGVFSGFNEARSGRFRFVCTSPADGVECLHGKAGSQLQAARPAYPWARLYMMTSKIFEQRHDASFRLIVELIQRGRPSMHQSEGSRLDQSAGQK